MRHRNIVLLGLVAITIAVIASFNVRSSGDATAQTIEYLPILPGEGFVVATDAGASVIQAATQAKILYGDAVQIADGVDDGVAINAAIQHLTDLGGGTVRLSKGNFFVSTKVRPKDNISIVGAGIDATMLNGIGEDIAGVIGSAGTNIDNPIRNIRISDLSIDSSLETQSSYSPANKGIVLHHVHGLQIERVRVSNTLASGIGADSIVDGVIRDCVVENTGRGQASPILGGNGIGIGTNNYKVENLLVEGCSVYGAARYGIMAEAQAAAPMSIGVRFIGNYVEGSQGCIQAGGVVHIVIQSNVCYKNGDGSMNGGGIIIKEGTLQKDFPGYHGIIDGNQVVDSDEYGIYIRGYGNEDGFGRGWRISNNKITGSTNVALRVKSNDMQLGELFFQDNDVWDNNRSGLYLDTFGTGSVVNMRISGNNIWNNGQTDSVIGSAIEINGKVDRILISDNFVFDDQVSKTQAYALRIRSSGVVNDGHVWNNYFSDNRWGEIRIEGAYDGTQSNNLNDVTVVN